MQKKQACKNHPQAVTTRKCYHCKKYICHECQLNASHHFFCGNWCLIRYYFFQIIFKNPRTREYAIVITIVFLFQWLLLSLMLPGSEETAAETNDNEMYSRPSGEVQQVITLDTLYTGISRTLLISGEGPDDRMLGLWHNGRYAAAADQDDGKFKFPPQPLRIGENIFVIWGVSAGGEISRVDSITITFSSQRIQNLAIPFSRMVTEQKVLALTFDGGSSANGADSLIEELAKNHIRSTFFLTGAFIKQFPQIIARLISNNMELANHTYTHPHLTTFEENNRHFNRAYVNREMLFGQLNKTDSLFYLNFGQHLSPFWRAPFGEYNREILTWAAECGYRHIGWSKNGDTRDWVSEKDSPLYRSGEEIYEHIMKMERDGQLNGAVILMHLHSDRHDDMPYKILPKIIEALREKNYQFLTVSELLFTPPSL